MTTDEFKTHLWPYTRKLYPMMKRMLGNEEETRDALQDLMLKLWNNREKLRECDNPGGYVFTAARNFCLDLRKRQKPRLVTIAGDEPARIPPDGPDPDAREKLWHVSQVMRNLPGKYREVLEMREIEGLSFDEMQALTGHGIPYLRVLLSRSRIKVKEELEKIYNYERGTCKTA
ncbi:MAG TPA: RNA polymerase sigma factor [Prolixibacteraceae bacterium]|nr:RNA polymerase sigma factor [Prolixibacteraceae bacterium]